MKKQASTPKTTMAPQPGLEPGTTPRGLRFATQFPVADRDRYLYFFLKPRVAPRTFELYASYLKSMPQELSTTALDTHFLTKLNKGTSGKTLNNELSALKGYLRWLDSRGNNSFDRVLMTYPCFRHVPKKFRRTLTQEEIHRLWKASGCRRYWWAFLLYTGLRKSEFEELTWNDICIDDNPHIRVINAKDKTRQRIIPLHDELTAILRDLKRNTEKPFRLPKRRCSLLRILKKDLKKAGISSEIDLHCLRVTFVSALARAGVSPRTAQELAGHKDIRTTLKIYTKVTDQDKINAVKKLKF